MEISVIHDLITRCVPRNVQAPWLKSGSTKVVSVYPFVFHVKCKKHNVDDVVVMPAGFVFDWASIPRFAWLLYPPNYSEARRGAAAHDLIYALLYPYYSKEFADDLLTAFMRLDRASKMSQWLFYWSVHYIGRGGWYFNQKQGTHPHWRQHHEKLSYDTCGEVSSSPFAITPNA